MQKKCSIQLFQSIANFYILAVRISLLYENIDFDKKELRKKSIAILFNCDFPDFCYF